MYVDNFKVSVIILTKNSAATIRATLESIFKQTRKPQEIVIVDGGSTDGTQEIVRQYPVKLISEPGLGYGYARNLGIKNAEGDIIFFIDSDCYAEPQWIEKMSPHFRQSEIAGVTGLTYTEYTGDASSLYARFAALFGGAKEVSRQRTWTREAYTLNLALRRDVVLEVGGFDETMVVGEDVELAYKVLKRYKILYEPEAIVWHRKAQTLRKAFRRFICCHIAAGQFLVKHGHNPYFRFSILIRGLILIFMPFSLFLTPRYVSIFLFIGLLIDFIYRTAKKYRIHRDPSDIPYMIFMCTVWSIMSIATLYGLYLGVKRKKISAL